MESAVAVHMKGRAWELLVSVNYRILSLGSRMEENDPRPMALWVMTLNQISTWLIQEE